MRETNCAICERPAPFDIIYPADFDANGLIPGAFSDRHTDVEKAHCRLVRCSECGLVRANPMIATDELARLYSDSGFNGATEIENVKRTYGRQLKRALRLACRRGNILDVGCGNGFFLERALDIGFEKVFGVEPSVGAVQAARPDIRPNIVTGMFKPGMFPPDSFDVITFFMLLDHLLEPKQFLSAIRKMLKPGGFVICVTHNVRSLLARLLGRRCPIFNIQHAYLYDKTTIAELFRCSDMEVLEITNLGNHYSLNYWLDYGLRLLPVGASVMRRLVLGATRALRIGRIPIPLRVGNIVVIARRGA